MLHFSMSNVQVKNVPPDLHQALRQRASEEGQTVSDYVLELLRRELALPSWRAWLADLATREPILVDQDTIVAAIHAERGDEP